MFPETRRNRNESNKEN